MLHLLYCVGTWCNRTVSLKDKSTPKHLLETSGFLPDVWWCVLCISLDYLRKQSRWCHNISCAATAAFTRWQYSWLIFHSTVNALKDMISMKSGKCRRNGRLWESWYISNVDCNTPLQRVDFCVSVVQCISNFVKFPYTTRFGIWSKPRACSSPATPSTCIPPYCLTVLVPLP